MNDQARMFDFLDKLRVSGITNMFGAAPFLEEEFGIDKREAKAALLAWMRTFKDGAATPEERARMAAEAS